MSLKQLHMCSTCSKSFTEEPSWMGQCKDCAGLCTLVPFGWTMIDTSFRRQRPANVHPRNWVMDPDNGLVKVDELTMCWNWQPGQHHGPQASPALFESVLAPNMHWAVKGKRARQVPAYYLFLNAPPDGMREPEADHYCCNRRCINPDHIGWVTKTENTRRNAIRERFSKRWQVLRDERAECPKCKGAGIGAAYSGRYGFSPCPTCEGTGKISKENELKGYNPLNFPGADRVFQSIRATGTGPCPVGADGDMGVAGESFDCSEGLSRIHCSVCDQDISPKSGYCGRDDCGLANQNVPARTPEYATDLEGIVSGPFPLDSSAVLDDQGLYP